MNIKVNDRVRVIHADGELSCLIGAIGEVNRIHELATGRIAIVKIVPDENIAREIFVKFPVENLEKIESKPEIPEGAKKISRADFNAAIDEITSPEKMFSRANPTSGFIAVLGGVLVSQTLREKIFKDQDVVVMTKDDFVVALWDACSPMEIAKQAGNKHSVRDTMRLSITALISLEDMVDILFGGSEVE